MPRVGTWYQILFDAVREEKYVHFETHLGVHRSGKLTGIKTKSIKINGSKKKVIDAFEVNGDPMDVVSFSEIASIDIGEEEE